MNSLISVKIETKEPFIPGKNMFKDEQNFVSFLNFCFIYLSAKEYGGYVYDEGVVSSPNYFSDNDNVTECVWYF